MRTRDLVFLSLRYARSRLVETLVIVLSTAIGVAVFTTAFGLIRAYSKDLNDTLERPEYREITVSPGTWQLAARNAPPAGPPRLSAEVAQRAAAACPAVSHGYVETQWGEGYLNVLRVSPPYFDAWRLSAAQGALLADEDIRQARNVAVIGARIARGVFKGESPIGKRIGSRDYRIIGVLRSAPSAWFSEEMSGSTDNTIFVPYTELPSDVQTWPVRLAFMVPPDGSIEAAESELRSFFAAEYGPNSVEISSRRAQVLTEQRIAVPLSALIAVLSATILVCLSVAILNLLYHRVARRRASLGLAAAVGASRRDTFGLFLAEFMFTGAGGGLLGIMLSFALGEVVQRFLNPQGSAVPGLRIAVTWPTVGFALCFVLVLELAMCLLPALHAARSSPVESMRGGQA